MFSLTYLCVDPILKAAYALRCFYGRSLQSGEDLKAELKQQSLLAGQGAACVALALMLMQPCSLTGAESGARTTGGGSARLSSARREPGKAQQIAESRPRKGALRTDAPYPP